jgi:hypothetical protein
MVERKDYRLHLWAYIAYLGWGMGAAGSLMLAWAGGVRDGVAPPYLIKGAFPACPNEQLPVSGVGNSAPIEAVHHPFVASKRGSKYYPADCPAAANLSSKNRIGFSSEDEAKAAGYTRTTSC